jgi:hypothetical protein
MEAAVTFEMADDLPASFLRLLFDTEESGSVFLQRQ